MPNIHTYFERLDTKIIKVLAHYGLFCMRVGLGFIFFWFGVLKFFPGLSPSEDIALRTMNILTVGVVPSSIDLLVLALWESLIGIGLILGRWLRLTIFFLLLQLGGTLLPILLLPHEVFSIIPFAPTMQGQYIILNVVLISAGLVLGSTVRGGHIVADDHVKYNVLCFYPSGSANYGISLYSRSEEEADTHLWNTSLTRTTASE